MSQIFIAEVRVNEVIHFPARENMEAKTVIKGYSIGADAYYATIEVHGRSADHTNNYLKKGSVIDIAGILKTRKVPGGEGEKDQYFTYIKPIRAIGFISGIKDSVERLELNSPESFKDLKAAKDAVAIVVQGFDIEVLPIQNLSFMSKLVESRRDPQLHRIQEWVESLARYFND